MTRQYIRDEEQIIPPSGATSLDLALASLLLPDEEIIAIGGFFKAFHLPSELRRELRDYVIALRIENVNLKSKIAKLELAALAGANDFYWHGEGES